MRDQPLWLAHVLIGAPLVVFTLAWRSDGDGHGRRRGVLEPRAAKRQAAIRQLGEGSHMPKMTPCGIRRGGDWQALTIAEALDDRKGDMRCPECHGRVQAHKEGTTGQRAHFEHKRANVACSFSSSWDGKSRRQHHTPLS